MKNITRQFPAYLPDAALALQQIKMMKAAVAISCFCFAAVTMLPAQHKNFAVGIALGIANTGFAVQQPTEVEVNRIYAPLVGLSIHNKIKNQWGIYSLASITASGNNLLLNPPLAGITKISTRSYYINLAVQPKFHWNPKWYVAFGPELAYLVQNIGTSYHKEEKINTRNETEYFNRFNGVLASALGFVTRAGTSRKKAPIPLDVYWFIELRAKKGFTNMLNRTYVSENTFSTVFAIELLSGITFTAKEYSGKY